MLNGLEYSVMTSSLRNFIQSHVEIKKLRTHSSLEAGKSVLELGCGSGHGTLLIKKHFAPNSIRAIDIDGRMVRRAKRLHSDLHFSFEEADATDLPYGTAEFDAVFDFAMIHTIPNWKDCVEEIKRVLKPGGELIIEDLSIESFTNKLGKLGRKYLNNPYETMYKKDDFIVYLKKLGFSVVHEESYAIAGLLDAFVVVATRN